MVALGGHHRAQRGKIAERLRDGRRGDRLQTRDVVVVGRHDDIFKDVGAEQEAGLVGKGIEAAAETGELSKTVDAVDEVDAGLGDRGGAVRCQQIAEKVDVRVLITGEGGEVVGERWVGEADQSRCGRVDGALSAGAGCLHGRQSRANGAAEVILGLQVFEVEEVVDKLDVVGGCRDIGLRSLRAGWKSERAGTGGKSGPGQNVAARPARAAGEGGELDLMRVGQLEDPGQQVGGTSGADGAGEIAVDAVGKEQAGGQTAAAVGDREHLVG